MFSLGLPLMPPPCPRAAAPPLLSAERSFGRCEFWSAEKASSLQVVNVIGRFRESSQWAERSSYAELEDESVSTTDQAKTAKRRDFAKKFDQVERVAFVENMPSLPFGDAALASSIGKAVEDFDSMEVEAAHLAVVFDALAHSKTTLVSKREADERIATWRTADGAFDADAFGKGLRIGLVSVLSANAVLYFFVGSGIAIACRLLLDAAQGKMG